MQNRDKFACGQEGISCNSEQGKAQLGQCSDSLPLALSCPCSWLQGGLSGAACTLLCTRMNLPAAQLVNNSVSPLVQRRWPVCPCAQSLLHVSPNPPPQASARDPATMGMSEHLPCSPARRLAQHQTPCLGNWTGIVLGQMDMPKLTAPVLALVLQPCAPLPAHRGHLLPWLQFRACLPWHAAVAWLSPSSWRCPGCGVALS